MGNKESHSGLSRKSVETDFLRRLLLPDMIRKFFYFAGKC